MLTSALWKSSSNRIRLRMAATAATPESGSTSTRQQQHTLPCGGHIAYRVTNPLPKADVDVVFLHGLCSDMHGTKARALEQHAQQHGLGYLCYDARGHGSSSGMFEDTDISHWYQDAVAAMSLAPCKRHILVGSSFGGWQALHLAAEQPQLVAGLVLVAPAVDITQQFWRGLSPEEQQKAEQTGRVALGSKYMEAGQITVKLQFFKAAVPYLLLDKLQQLQVSCPVRILHGVQDDTVPVATSLQLFQQLPASDAALTLVKDGDHRLSRPQDLQLLLSTVSDLLRHVSM